LMTHGRDLTVQHMGNNADYACYEAWKRDCPNARATADQGLLLPTYPGHGEDEVRRNALLIRRYFDEQRRHRAPGARAAAPADEVATKEASARPLEQRAVR